MKQKYLMRNKECNKKPNMSSFSPDICMILGLGGLHQLYLKGIDDTSTNQTTPISPGTKEPSEWLIHASRCLVV